MVRKGDPKTEGQKTKSFGGHSTAEDDTADSDLIYRGRGRRFCAEQKKSIK